MQVLVAGANGHVGDSSERVSAACASRQLRQLVEQHSLSITRFLSQRGLSRADVDDVVQRVWLTALRWLDRLQPGRERAFLLSVARREAGHLRRALRRRPELVGMDLDSIETPAPGTDDVVARRQLLERVACVLEQMDESLRTVLWLFEVKEATTQEVSKQLGIPAGTAKSRLRRARADYARRSLSACY